MLRDAVADVEEATAIGTSVRREPLCPCYLGDKEHLHDESCSQTVLCPRYRPPSPEPERPARVHRT